MFIFREISSQLLEISHKDTFSPPFFLGNHANVLCVCNSQVCLYALSFCHMTHDLALKKKTDKKNPKKWAGDIWSGCLSLSISADGRHSERLRVDVLNLDGKMTNKRRPRGRKKSLHSVVRQDLKRKKKKKTERKKERKKQKKERMWVEAGAGHAPAPRGGWGGEKKSFPDSWWKYQPGVS